MAEAQADSQFASRFREGFLDRRRAARAELLPRARRRGDAPPVAAELAADGVSGASWSRVRATARPCGGAALVALSDRPRSAPPLADAPVAAGVVGVIWYRVLATDRPSGEADPVALRDLLTSTFTNPDPSSRIGSTHV